MVQLDPGQDERRLAQRKPTGTAGLVSSPELAVAIPCLVCDMSATGARLFIHESTDNPVGPRARIPARFTLAMKMDRIEIDCGIVWRQSGEIGVRFLAPARLLARKGR